MSWNKRYGVEELELTIRLAMAKAIVVETVETRSR